jgi:hypothetical protein
MACQPGKEPEKGIRLTGPASTVACAGSALMGTVMPGEEGGIVNE